MADEQDLSPDITYTFLCHCNELDKVETALRIIGETALLAALVKLQQDVGVDHAADAQRYGYSVPADEWPRTVGLVEEYEGNLAARLPLVLRACQGRMADLEVRAWLTKFMRELGIEPTALVPAPAPPRLGM